MRVRRAFSLDFRDQLFEQIHKHDARSLIHWVTVKETNHSNNQLQMNPRMLVFITDCYSQNAVRYSNKFVSLAFQYTSFEKQQSLTQKYCCFAPTCIIFELYFLWLECLHLIVQFEKLFTEDQLDLYLKDFHSSPDPKYEKFVREPF